MNEQLVFDLPHRPAFGAEDFFVSACNRVAVRLVDTWPSWSNPVHVIVGPPGSGKSHLANVWRLNSGARVAGPDDLAAGVPEALVSSPSLVLEDADRRHVDDAVLFHLLNLCKEQNASLLMTARIPPAEWPAALPDLRSRLRSLPVVTIGPPDDDLLRAVLVKHFVDRQLNVEPRLITYLTARMERSMDAAARMAALLDKSALETGRKITRQFAGEVLEAMGDGTCGE